jgi:hypothetical protein
VALLLWAGLIFHSPMSQATGHFPKLGPLHARATPLLTRAPRSSTACLCQKRAIAGLPTLPCLSACVTGPLLFFSAWRAQAGPRFPSFFLSALIGKLSHPPLLLPPRPRDTSQGEPCRHLPHDTTSLFVYLTHGIHHRERGIRSRHRCESTPLMRSTCAAPSFNWATLTSHSWSWCFRGPGADHYPSEPRRR